VDQGKHVALAVVLCAAAAAVARLAVTPLEQRAARVVAAAGSRGVVRAGLAATALAGVALALALGGAAWLHDEVHDFLKAPPGKATDLRQRLTDPSSSGRTEHWRVAFEGFAEARVKGHGAGSYEFLWDAKRRLTTSAVDAHGLYFETLAELGIVGLVLLVAPLLAIVAAFALLAVGRNRSIYAALLGAGVAWAVHAGYDWDWEMPVTTAWLFAAGGAALARRGTERVRKQQPLAHGSRRYLICAGLLATAVAPALLTLSQAHLARSANAFNARNCRAADREALASISALADRPEPYQILGYCDMADGRPQAAIAAMQKAIRKEPDSWEYRYGLALARAEAGTDPHEDLADAAVRSPRETLIRQATQVFAGPGSPTRWQREAERMRITTVESGQLTLK
jgi:tetratricopeptide (TPR) repeat protein